MTAPNFQGLRPFSTPIFVTQPLLPDMNVYSRHLCDVWTSKILTNGGSKHQALEYSLSNYLDAPNFSLFSNGTIALMVALQALELKGEVIVTPFTFAATAHVLAWNKLTPVFVDIDPLTMNIDVSRIEEAITHQTSAILGVHVYGNPCDVYRIDEIAKRYKLKVVYDAAHAFGVRHFGQSISAFGDATMFSFHATKLFQTGEGGGLVVNSETLKNRVDLLKNFGIKNQSEVILPGINGKMSELQASLGLSVLELVANEKLKRLEIYNIYASYLTNVPGISFPKTPNMERDSFQYFVIRINKSITNISRDDIYDLMAAYNVFPRKYFFPLCSNFDCYKLLPSSSPSNLPNANNAASEVLCLPFYGALALEHAAAIAQLVRLFVEGATKPSSRPINSSRSGVGPSDQRPHPREGLSAA